MTKRIYIVGAGAIASFHVEAIERYYEQKERPIVKITDVNKQAMDSFINKYKWVVPIDNILSLLEEDALVDDIVIVATPPFTHANITCMALESGRHVLCEKPLAMNDHESAMILQTVKKTGKSISCCSSRFVGMRITKEVKQILDNGEIGELYQVKWIQRRKRARSGIEYQPQSKWFLNPTISGGGTLMDWGPYDMTSLIEILNPIKVEVLHAWMTTPSTDHELDTEENAEVEQHVGATLVFTLVDSNRVVVQYERAACCHGEESSTTQIEGSHGAVIWDWPLFSGEGNLTRFYDENGETKYETRNITNEELGMMDKPIIYFIEQVAGENQLAVTNEQAVFNFNVLHAIYKYIQTKEVQIITL
ncbi:Gfo/Idh/MocA family protein [Paenibacillus endoradicis]|uniref:Gfo/Idh/MocA family protein n=1 Tax=Paenibacillus endoradicis TaxID=2972487 RepID=UPI0021594D57|nr:Gfo/Idh/MocA family oxidoreductase [Paenibacillus endoradicis]MCR8657154.1 Gfo/Idh/MocA family oxidoreductase [Paenibacillus endoradicis]